ncbi:MAG: hypothetical protein CM15mP68_0960 [Pseudomonadota bacterium]|nr:MAG: hypothetical protein CM15mP68_0960 [Pseudomonadota bacterium]
MLDVGGVGYELEVSAKYCAHTAARRKIQGTSNAKYTLCGARGCPAIVRIPRRYTTAEIHFTFLCQK